MHKGGDFLLSARQSDDLFSPEDLDSEALAMGDAAADFMRGEVLAAADRLESKEPGLMSELLARAARIGLLGLDIPEEFGGLGLKKSASARISEVLSVEPSFSVSHSVHTSVSSLPILFFGSDEQKAKYLPQLAAGERIGAYALSESHAGSDAMAAKTRAAKSDGGYTLSGEKMWITNAGFAGLLIVFAQTTDGLTAFLIERDVPGVSVGREEHKLGLKGSSTCRVILDSVSVPETDVIGQPGEGGKVALYTLNLGRFKIAASAVGQSKRLLKIATEYATQRVTFGRPIAKHGLIQQKLAEMAAGIFAAETMLYALAGFLDEAFAGAGTSAASRDLSFTTHPSEEFAIECAIVKVYCTEALDFVADETLQIHGGYGYTEDFPAARAWRDARVTRIYEGTNEIIRLNIVGMTLKRIEQKRIETDDGLLELARGPCPTLSDNQVALGALADWLIHKFASYCVSSRIGKLESAGDSKDALEAVQYILSFCSRPVMHQSARSILGACGGIGQAYWSQLQAAWGDEPLVDIAASIDVLSEAVVAAGGYPW